MVAFIVRELVTDEPIVNLRILRDRNFATGTVLITAMGVALYGTTALLPLFLQTLLGYPALEAGLATSPRGLGRSSPPSWWAPRRVLDARLLVAVGFGFLALSGVWLSRLPSTWRGRNIAFVDVPERPRQPAHLHRALDHSFGTLRRGADGRGHRHLQPDAQPGRQHRHLAGHHAAARRRAQVHQNMLVARMTPYDPVYQQKLRRSGGPSSQGRAPRGGPAGPGRPLPTLVAQATLLAFVDNFRLMTVLAICSVPLVLLLKRVRARGRRRRALRPRRDRYLEGAARRWRAGTSRRRRARSRDCTPSRRWPPMTHVGKAFTPAFSQRSGRALTPLGRTPRRAGRGPRRRRAPSAPGSGGTSRRRT